MNATERKRGRKEEHVRKEGKNMDRPPRPRLCFTHPEQNEGESERGNTKKRINCAGNWIGQSGRQEGGRATQATPRHNFGPNNLVVALSLHIDGKPMPKWSNSPYRR